LPGFRARIYIKNGRNSATAGTDGPDGIMQATTYIQRVNTKDGLAPTAPGASIGATAEVPYTAEYYFYRAED
jgi:hypothetical protein